MNNVWVFIEQNHGKLQPIGLELLSECRRKLDASVQISAVYLGQSLQAKDIDAMTF